MKSLFESTAKQEILDRLDTLTAETQPQWGSMDAAQMLKHLNATMKIATGEVSIHPPAWHRRILFRLFRSALYNDRPWKKNLPTARELRVADTAAFTTEKDGLLDTMEKFLNLSFPNGKKTHPIFGTFTKAQWGKMQYKHLDHHLRQFGL